MIAFAAIALALAVLFFVLYVRPQDLPAPEPVSPVQHLEDRKAAIYENLRDLQFEYRLGKLSDEDYRQTKLALQRELAVVLSEIDEIVKRLGISMTPAVKKKTPAKPLQTTCPHCGATFPQALKFCGECGKAIA